MASSLRMRTARVDLATLRVDDRAKEGKGRGGREKKISLLPTHFPLPFTCSPVKLWFSIKVIATELFSTPFNSWMAI